MRHLGDAEHHGGEIGLTEPGLDRQADAPVRPDSHRQALGGQRPDQLRRSRAVPQPDPDPPGRLVTAGDLDAWYPC